MCECGCKNIYSSHLPVFSLMPQWRTPLLAQRWKELKMEFGAPAQFQPQFVTWTNPAFFSRITLHNKEEDFLQVVMGNVELPLEGREEMRTLHPNVSYDVLNKRLIATTTSMPVAATLLQVALDVALDDEMTVAEAQAALPGLLEEAVRNPQRYLDIMRSLEDNVKSINN
jgi:hypothetical protein